LIFLVTSRRYRLVFTSSARSCIKEKSDNA